MPLTLKKLPVADLIQKVEPPTQQVLVIPADAITALLHEQQRNSNSIASALADSQRRPESITFKVISRDAKDRISEAVLTPIYAKKG